jgi:hypothetical protein
VPDTLPAVVAGAHARASAFVAATLEHAFERLPVTRVLADDLLEKCGVRLCDLIDHVGLPDQALPAALGWREDGAGVWRLRGHPNLVSAPRLTVALRVEDLDRFSSQFAIGTQAEADFPAPSRRVRVDARDEICIDVVERNGRVDYAKRRVPQWRAQQARMHQQIFRTRRRSFRTAYSGLSETLRLVLAAVSDLGATWACDLFLRAEREYWQRRCTAGFLQWRRQQSVGIGWSNADHHGYVASRLHFLQTIDVFAALGFELGEVISAGDWASQVLRHAGLNACVAVDVDLGPQERPDNIRKSPLNPLIWHGAAGLWSALHGESLLDGGLQRLGCRFDRGAIARLLRADAIDLLAPTSSRAAFFQQPTAAEVHPVDPKRVARLERAEFLNADQARVFAQEGALGAQMVIVERNDGFTGFDQPMTPPVRVR